MISTSTLWWFKDNTQLSSTGKKRLLARGRNATFQKTRRTPGDLSRARGPFIASAEKGWDNCALPPCAVVRHIMTNDVEITDLSTRIDLVPLLARLHFRQWGELTGASTESGYKALLSGNATAPGLPMTLIALGQDKLLGSVNIVNCDMDIRPELKPWLAQLYVAVPERGRGIGSALVRAAVERSGKLGFSCLYLYTSGTLPSFYERIGWKRREIVYYKNKERTLMEMALFD
jgi:GNAT superfamily N-acetyltransferase